MARTTTKPRASTRRGFKATGSAAPAIDASHKEVKVGGEKNGATRLVPAVRASRFYPADDVLPPKKSKKATPATSLRATITPGTILILLLDRLYQRLINLLLISSLRFRERSLCLWFPLLEELLLGGGLATRGLLGEVCVGEFIGDLGRLKRLLAYEDCYLQK